MTMATEKKKSSLLSLIILEILIALLPFIFYLLIFNRLPAIVAVHYGANHVPNRWAPKLSFDMIFLCALGFLGIIVGKALNLFCVAISPDQSNRKTVRKIMVVTELFLVTLFSFLSTYFLIILLGSVKPSFGIIMRAVLSGLSVLWIGMGNYMPKLKRNGIVGIKTIFALRDEGVWFKVQRFGGKAMILCGIAGLILASCIFIPNSISDSIIVALNAIMLIAIFIYDGVQGVKLNKK